MRLVVSALLFVLAASGAKAQGVPHGVPQAPQAPPAPVPATHRPPAGMCRIWLDNVPAGRQPAPTDCSTAIRRRPPNARVIFGDAYRAQDSSQAAQLRRDEQRERDADSAKADTSRRKPPSF